MTQELVREDITKSKFYDSYYPPICGNDSCERDARYRFGWGEANSEGYCSFKCWLDALDKY